jgi:hypothetical protein
MWIFIWRTTEKTILPKTECASKPAYPSQEEVIPAHIFLTMQWKMSSSMIARPSKSPIIKE